MAPQFTRPPPAIPDNIVILSFPAPNVLHVAMNRPKAYNAMSSQLSMTLSNIFDWYEAEPSLWVAVLASTNRKAWCAGADLKEWVSTCLCVGPKPRSTVVHGYADGDGRARAVPGRVREVVENVGACRSTYSPPSRRASSNPNALEPHTDPVDMANSAQKETGRTAMPKNGIAGLTERFTR